MFIPFLVLTAWYKFFVNPGNVIELAQEKINLVGILEWCGRKQCAGLVEVHWEAGCPGPCTLGSSMSDPSVENPSVVQ